jgi:hypothetical protein
VTPVQNQSQDHLSLPGGERAVEDGERGKTGRG